jgi:hypothetical protein
VLIDCCHQFPVGQGDFGDAMTSAKRAWIKANRYMNSGRHRKAVYWFEETQRILSEERPARRRHGRLDLGYMLVAFAALILIFASDS